MTLARIIAAGVVSLATARRRARSTAALPIANRYARPTWTRLDRVDRF